MTSSAVRGPLAGSRRPVREQARPAEDRRERRAQLVRERGQELVLHPVRLARLRVERVLDRDRAHLRELRQDGLVLVGRNRRRASRARGAGRWSRPSRPVSGAASQPSRPAPSLDEEVVPARRFRGRRGRWAGPDITDRSETSAARSRRTQPLLRATEATGSSDAAPSDVVPLLIRRRHGDRLARSENVPREVGHDLQDLARGERRVDGERGLRELLELRRPPLERCGLRAGPARSCGRARRRPTTLARRTSGIDRREDVVDGAERIAARGVRLVGVRGDEDDRRVLGRSAAGGSAPPSRSRPCRACCTSSRMTANSCCSSWRSASRPGRAPSTHVLAELAEHGAERRGAWPGGRRRPGCWTASPSVHRPSTSAAEPGRGARRASARCRRAWRGSPRRPASMHFSRSPFIALAVTAMIGRSRNLPRLADRAHRVVAVHLRHHDVHQHDVDVRASPASISIASRPVSAETTSMSLPLEHARQREDVADVVVDDQHLLAGEHACRSRRAARASRAGARAARATGRCRKSAVWSSSRSSDRT